MECIKKEFVRTDADGHKWWRVILTATEAPESLDELTGADVDGMDDNIRFAAGSVLLTPDGNSVLYEDGWSGGGGDATIELIGITDAPLGYFDVCYADDIQYILDEDEERITVVQVTSEPVTITVPIGGAIYPMVDGSTTVETTGGLVEKTVDSGITYFEVTGDGSITMTQDQ